MHQLLRQPFHPKCIEITLPLRLRVSELGRMRCTVNQCVWIKVKSLIVHEAQHYASLIIQSCRGGRKSSRSTVGTVVLAFLSSASCRVNAAQIAHQHSTVAHACCISISQAMHAPSNAPSNSIYCCQHVRSSVRGKPPNGFHCKKVSLIPTSSALCSMYLIIERHLIDERLLS